MTTISDKTPPISVVMAVYNAELFLREAIDSILSQSFRDFEFIIVNDGSTDGSARIIADYRDPRIIVLDNGKNRGLIDSLNAGLERARGKYIARMDADDIALKERFQKQFDYMETHPEMGICGTAIRPFRENEKGGRKMTFPTDDERIRAFAFFQSPFCHPSVIMRKEVLDRHHLKYPQAFKHAEDYGLWIELLKYTRGANLDTVLLLYRRHEQSVTVSLNKDAEETNRLVGKVQDVYWSQYNIGIEPDSKEVFFRFLNRWIPTELSAETQQILEKSVHTFLRQLSPGTLKEWVVHYLAEICFFRFYTLRRIPLGRHLWSLSTKGAWIYRKKLINRTLNRDK